MKTSILTKVFTVTWLLAWCGIAGGAQTAAKELARDNGVSAGKKSIAGSGHAVQFEAPGKNYCLTGVRIYGSRYGHPNAPNETAYFWLCDSDFKMISTFPIAYSSFTRGEPKWVTFPTKPTPLPEKFVICAGFNPTATKGVFVHYDGAAGGNSFSGLPGSKGGPFDKGNWMIRAMVQEARE